VSLQFPAGLLARVTVKPIENGEFMESFSPLQNKHSAVLAQPLVSHDFGFDKLED